MPDHDTHHHSPGSHGPRHTSRTETTPQTTGKPRWVRMFLIALGIAVVAFLAVHMATGGMGHMGGR